MPGFFMQQIHPQTLTSIDLHNEAAKNAGNPTLEAYTVVIDGQAERAEVLYFGDRDIAGVAWGADANWHECVDSAEAACQAEFGESDDDATAEDAPRPRATAYRDPSYHQGLHDGYESSDAILHAVEEIAGMDLLAETYACFWCDITGETPDAVCEAHAEESPCREHLGFFEPELGDNPARQLWQDDPDNRVPAYLAAHFSAQEGDELDWGAGSLTYSNGAWA